MLALRLTTIAAAAACALAIADGAQARSPYDGSWSVSVAGRSGACAGGNYAYNVEIRNGIVRYNGGDAQISGRVSGGGSFRGASQQGACAGTWSGQRTGM